MARHKFHAKATTVDGVIDPGNVTLRMPHELVSPNRWNGRHWRVKHRISQDWETAISVSLIDACTSQTDSTVSGMNVLAAYLGPKRWLNYQPARIKVSVTREVPSGRNFIRDDDNLRFCVKPLLDALKRQGYIKNDSRKWIELPTPEQKISADGKYWTVVILEACGDGNVC